MSRLAAVQWVGGSLIALSIGALALQPEDPGHDQPLRTPKRIGGGS